jgi:hypothetical protein
MRLHAKRKHCAEQAVVETVVSGEDEEKRLDAILWG